MTDARSWRIDTYGLEPRYTVHELVNDETGNVDRTYWHPEDEPGECPYCDEDESCEDDDDDDWD
jgi:hypothetical protein